MGADSGAEFTKAALKGDVQILCFGWIVVISQAFWISVALQKLTFIDASLALNAVCRNHLNLLRQLWPDRWGLWVMLGLVCHASMPLFK